jgi:tetratricopeptide (TPR) repeat protein
LVAEVDNRADQFAFRHALTRQAVYEPLLGRERRALHRRVGETIEQLFAGAAEPRLEDLAYHFSEAGDWAKALVYAERAGERADALYAPAAAVEHYARAMEAARRQAMPVPPRLHRARGLAYERLGTFDLAWADHEAALVAARVAGDRHAEWQALLDLGFLWAGRAYEQTRAYFAEALGLARALDDPPALARSLNRVGNWHVNVEQPAEGERHHREALAIFEHLDDRRGIAETLDLLGLAEYMRGNPVEAVGYLDRAIALFRELDDRASLTSALAHPGRQRDHLSLLYRADTA